MPSTPSPPPSKARSPPPPAFLNTAWGRAEASGLHPFPSSFPAPGPIPPHSRQRSTSRSPSQSLATTTTSASANGAAQQADHEYLFPRTGALPHLPDLRDATYEGMARRAQRYGMEAPRREEVWRYADMALPLLPKSLPQPQKSLPSSGRKKRVEGVLVESAVVVVKAEGRVVPRAVEHARRGRECHQAGPGEEKADGERSEKVELEWEYPAGRLEARISRFGGLKKSFSTSGVGARVRRCLKAAEAALLA